MSFEPDERETRCKGTTVGQTVLVFVPTLFASGPVSPISVPQEDGPKTKRVIHKVLYHCPSESTG